MDKHTTLLLCALSTNLITLPAQALHLTEQVTEQVTEQATELMTEHLLQIRGKQISDKTTKSVEQVPAAKSTAAVEHAAVATPTKTIANVTTNSKVAQDHDIWFHSIDISLQNDINDNGYYSRIIVDFDADTVYEYSSVYATLSLTDPNGVTTDYYTTDDFNLYGDSGDDIHQVETLLTHNWLTDYYDLSIQLFDAYSEELLAYVDFHHAPQLDYLALESQEYDTTAQYLSTFSSKLWLQNDDDGDGYYHSFNIELDIDASFGTADVYVELYVSTDQFSWLPLYTSGHFIVAEDSVSDAQQWQFDWLSGYPTAHYYLKAIIVDANNDDILLTVLPEHNPAFAVIPLEDASFEIAPPVTVVVPDTSNTINTINTINNTTTKSTVSSESSGGSIGAGVMFGLMMLFRRLPKYKTTLS